LVTDIHICSLTLLYYSKLPPLLQKKLGVESVKNFLISTSTTYKKYKALGNQLHCGVIGNVRKE
jgi:hypothetical protein